MATAIFDGLDLYQNAAEFMTKYYSSSVSLEYSATAGRFGGGAIFRSSDDWTVGMSLTTSDNYVMGGYAFKPFYMASSAIIAALSTGAVGINTVSSHNLYLYLTQDGKLVAYGGASQYLGETSAGTVNINQWHYLELRCYKHDSAGTAEVWLNGAKVLDFSGVDTNSGSGNVFLLGTNSGNIRMYVDDFYAASDSSSYTIAAGDKKVTTSYPNADTAQADFSMSAGSDGYALIDEAGYCDNDTTYVYSSTVGHKSAFDFTDLPGSPGVFAVQLNWRAKKSDAGAKTMRGYIVSSSSTLNGDEVGPSETAYGLFKLSAWTDPATSSAWTYSGVNAAKIGIEIMS